MDLSLAALILALVSLLSAIICLVVLSHLRSHYNSLVKNTNTKDLVVSLNDILKSIRHNKEEIEKLDKDLNTFMTKSRVHFQKFSFRRFNPFAHTGGDQSFVLCLLDENNDGIVISSLHSRENTRLYAKRLLQGKSADQVLSKEESEIVSQVVKT